MKMKITLNEEMIKSKSNQDQMIFKIILKIIITNNLVRIETFLKGMIFKCTFLYTRT